MYHLKKLLATTLFLKQNVKIVLDSFINFFTQYLDYWPLACAVMLLFAGINIPVSEDALIILSAGIAANDRTMIVPNWIGLFVGIFVSDIISYYLGRLVSRGARQIKSLRKHLTPKKIRLVSRKIDEYGFRTFIVCRFVPFGVRNTLFMCSGFVHLEFKKFVLYDLVASVISLTTLYTLVYFLGQKASLGFKIGGIIFFVILVGIAIYFVVQAVRSDDFVDDEEDNSEEEIPSQSELTL